MLIGGKLLPLIWKTIYFYCFYIRCNGTETTYEELVNSYSNEFEYYKIITMDTDISIFIITLFPYAIIGVILYFVAVRKNAFEERVAHYIPYHALERERSTYMEKVEKYKRYICIGLGIFLSVFIVLPFVIFFVAISKEGVNFSVPEQLTLLMIPLSLFLMIYWKK